MPDWAWIITLVGAAAAVLGASIATWNAYSTRHSRRADNTARRFDAVRRYLKANRARLSSLALRMYQATPDLDGVALLFGPGWIPDEPIPLGDVGLRLDPTRGGFDALVRSLRPEWPARADGSAFESYSAAIGKLDRPSNFFNGPSYRLLDVSADAGQMRLTVGAEHYFDYLDTGEALAFEFARTAISQADRWSGGGRPTASDRRRRAGGPFEFRGRCASIGISTLTLVKRGPGWEFWMHERKATKVAAAQDTNHVIPAGEFQPTSVSRVDLLVDLDLWRNVAREFVEELLDLDDIREERGRPVDFRAVEGLNKLDEARRLGDLRAYILGIGIDPLPLKTELLACMVITAAAFDDVVGSPVRMRNREGLIVGPSSFTLENVDSFLGTNILPAGGGTLRLAWRHRGFLTAAISGSAESKIGSDDS